MQEPDSITFDRGKPLYRLFLKEDGTREWWTVVADNTPGRLVDDFEAALVQEQVDKADWKDAFYAAFEKNGKATIYGKIVDPYVVPEGCDAILRGARIETWGDKRQATGSIYGDRRNRWVDGHPIHTSMILEGPDEAGIIKTRNSTYKLEMAAGVD
jgi:hypothetical protein